MATRAQVEAVYNNPNVRKFLDVISKAEGTTTHGYNTGFGNVRFDSLADHPRTKKSFKQTDGKSNLTSAAGRYQFIAPTWDGVAKQLGLTDFSAKNQDLGAIQLLYEAGAMPSILKGDWTNAIKKTGKTWASFPSSSAPQHKRSWATMSNFFNAPLSPTMPDVPRGTSLQDALNQQNESVANAMYNLGIEAQQPQIQLLSNDVPRGTSLQQMVDMPQQGLVNNQMPQYDWTQSLVAEPSNQGALGNMLNQQENNILLDTLKKDEDEEFILDLTANIQREDYGY